MPDPQGTLLSVVLFDVAIAGSVVGVFWLAVSLLRRWGKKLGYSLAPLGFSRPRGGFVAGIGAGMAVGIGTVLLSMIVNPISVFVLERLGYSTESTVQQPLMEGLVGWVRESPGVAIPAIVLIVVLFGPAVEELVFRGAIFNGLYRLGALVSTRSFGKEHSERPFGKTIFIASALVSSVLFALLHLEPVLLPVLLVLAITLCALFQRTGSLLPPFVAHATFNSVAAVLIILRGLNVLNIPIQRSRGCCPTYLALGRMREPLRYCSMAWPIQPTVLPRAKSATAPPAGISSVRATVASAKSTVGRSSIKRSISLATLSESATAILSG
jgi:uncharacterized protein